MSGQDLAAYLDWPDPDVVSSPDAAVRAELVRRITTPSGAHAALGRPEVDTVDVRELIESRSVAGWAETIETVGEQVVGVGRVTARVALAERAAAVSLDVLLLSGDEFRLALEIGAAGVRVA